VAPRVNVKAEKRSNVWNRAADLSRSYARANNPRSEYARTSLRRCRRRRRRLIWHHSPSSPDADASRPNETLAQIPLPTQTGIANRASHSRAPLFPRIN